MPLRKHGNQTGRPTPSNSPTDEATGEGKEAFVDVVAAVGTDEESAAVVKPGEGAFDDPAVMAEADVSVPRVPSG
jgi:hypothetical protein